MIVVDARKLRFLRAGRFVTVETDHALKRGHVCGLGVLGVRHGRRMYQAEVVQVERISRRLGFVLTIRLVPESDRFLARNPGAQRRDYVRRPSQALRGEGAAIDDRTLARYVSEAYRRDDALRREQAAERQKPSKRRYAA